MEKKKKLFLGFCGHLHIYVYVCVHVYAYISLVSLLQTSQALLYNSKSSATLRASHLSASGMEVTVPLM